MPKTVNNVLTVLSVLLKKAVEWNVIDGMPCSIRLVKVPKGSMGFYDFGDYEQLVQASKLLGPVGHLIRLLEQHIPRAGSGDMLETTEQGFAKSLP